MQRPASIQNEGEWHAACQNVVKTARAILSHELGIIEGARKLCSLRFAVKAENDEDFIFFVGIESETDHLPAGNAQKNWNPIILAEKKKSIEEYESSIRERVARACNNLIERYRI